MVARPTYAKQLADEEGQALVEYALLIMLVALVCVSGLTAIGISVSSFFSAMASAL